MSTVSEEAHQLGFENMECLAAWPCPAAAIIQTELDRRARHEGEIAKVAERSAAESVKRATAAGAIEHMLQAREIPTDASIVVAREDRDETWRAIRDRYLSAQGEAVASRPVADRAADIDRHRQQSEAADRLADRKSLEAERLAALDLAQRQNAEAVSAIENLEKQHAELDARWQQGVRAWEVAWPEAAKQENDLGRLKALIEERERILGRFAALRELVEDIDGRKAEMGLMCLALEQTEAKLNVDAGEASLQERVSAATKAIKIHEDAYADFRHDEKEIRDVTLRRQKTKASLDALRNDEADWRALWAPAVSALGLAESIEPGRANEIATQWAVAGGIVDGLRLTRERLRRMDEDENELREKIAAVAGKLDFVLPHDCLAAARMLEERLDDELKTANERRILTRELKEGTAERERKHQACEAALAKVAGLSSEAGCESDDIEALASRRRQYGAARDRRHALVETILRSGDGFPADVLREQSAGRDLDVLKADLFQAEQVGARLAAELETALGEAQSRTRELEQFSASGGINQAVAAREAAIAGIHEAVEGYIEIALAKDLLSEAMDKIRAEQQDPLIRRASALFSASTQGAFCRIETDIDDKGNPVVAGRRASDDLVHVAQMSDGVRDQLFLAFRIASVERYCLAAEPLSFIADDLLVHFDDGRGAAALGLLAELGKTTQVILFTHHRHVRKDAEALIARRAAAVIDLT